MEFSFTEEQEILRTQVRKLLEDVCPPEYAAKCDVDAVPPREAYNAIAEQGWLRLTTPHGTTCLILRNMTTLNRK